MKTFLAFLMFGVIVSPLVIDAQRPRGLPAEPQVFNANGQLIRVVAIEGLVRPWALANLPNGDILVTEREGRLRIIRNDVLDPEPITGLPVINTGAVNSGLMDIALHPDYSSNHLVYFAYFFKYVQN